MFTELLALVIGQNATEALRDSRSSRELLPQEPADAFSGVTSAALASFGFLIGLCAALGGVLLAPGKLFIALAIVAVIGIGCSYSAYCFGRRAPHVTRRFLGMAKYAVVVSATGMVLAAASLVLIAVRMFP